MGTSDWRDGIDFDFARMFSHNKIGIESLETEKGRRCFLANIKKPELIVDDYTTVIDMIRRPSPSKGSPSDLVSTRLLVNLILSH